MKKIFFTIIIIASAFNGFGQTDPLEKVFNDPEFMPILKLLFTGNLDSCEIQLNKFDDTHPKYESVVYLKSQCHWEQRNYKELKKDLEYILPNVESDNPEYSNLMNLYGLSQRHTNEKNEAINTFKKAYKITHDQIHLINLVATYNDLKRYKESILFEPELNQDTIGNLHFLIGEAFYYISKFNKAEQHLNKYLNKYWPTAE